MHNRYNTELHKKIAETLRAARDKVGETNERLAEATGYDSSLIAQWLNPPEDTKNKKIKKPDIYALRDICLHLGISADDILLIPQTGKSTFSSTEVVNGIEFRTWIPSDISAHYRQEIVQGIDMFRRCIEGKEIPHKQGKVVYTAALKAVLNQGFLEIIDVDRITEAEKEICEKYSIQRAIVADTRLTTSWHPVRAELIAVLAARIANEEANFLLSDDPAEYSGVGIDDGFTLSRFVSHLMSGRDAFTGAEWFPLAASEFSGRSYHLSANHLSAELARNYPNSVPRYFPDIRLPIRERDQQEYWTLINDIRDRMRLVFISVNGWQDNRSKTIRAADEDTPLYDLDDILLPQEIDRFVGEIIGIPFAADGRILECKQTIEGITDLAGMEKRLDRIRDLAYGDRGFVWLLAANTYKAEPTRVALTRGWVNGVIIDASIAEYLLDGP